MFRKLSTFGLRKIVLDPHNLVLEVSPSILYRFLTTPIERNKPKL